MWLGLSSGGGFSLDIDSAVLGYLPVASESGAALESASLPGPGLVPGTVPEPGSVVLAGLWRVVLCPGHGSLSSFGPC